MNPIFYALIGLVVILLVLAMLYRKPEPDSIAYEISDDLINEIEQLEIYRDSLIEQVEAIKQNSFPRMIENVLNEYETSNIRIPADILEELAHNGFTDEEDVRRFIENQRHHWKLENSKKVYK